MTSFIKLNSVDKELQYENTLSTLNNMNSNNNKTVAAVDKEAAANVPIEHDQ